MRGIVKSSSKSSSLQEYKHAKKTQVNEMKSKPVTISRQSGSSANNTNDEDDDNDEHGNKKSATDSSVTVNRPCKGIESSKGKNKVI